MSSVSVTSSKRELKTSELTMEIEAVRELNSSLRTYLEHLRLFKKNLLTMNRNSKELNKVNTQWIDMLNSK
ncbi:uncharacterized protein LOC114360163 [Ostrinia furnacalis]|uniref:uncharacterized protein LOC114360163 n=1 Tax=Ostrinia furnacalis TaxID=93504 RepID=UPI001039FFF5|nr:uncharacterized protein LOC114360163 [Ostrinia furnacalis]